MPSADPAIRSRPRVLLVGRDRRYLTEASCRLRKLGFEVVTTCRPSEIVDLIRRLDVHVAVVDGSHYLSAIVRTMAAIEAAEPPLAILNVVDDALISPLSRRDVMPKWASLAQLDEHVELAFRAAPQTTYEEVGVAFA